MIGVSSEAHSGHAGAASIARASAEFAGQRQAWLTERRQNARGRHTVRVVDALLDDVEEINLSGRGRLEDPLISLRLRRLQSSLRTSVPGAVLRSRTGHELHAALLDWQDELLDEVSPARAGYRDDDDGRPEIGGAALQD
ncbi:MAG TPA: hypothetical protein VGQ42_10195 [Candidatus Dormibacteraeota bacterium]|jgi:hypothetical protein|nr:hypothetical protein [Candidatus Dormibacteraeota bacterium]